VLARVGMGSTSPRAIRRTRASPTSRSSNPACPYWWRLTGSGEAAEVPASGEEATVRSGHSERGRTSACRSSPSGEYLHRTGSKVVNRAERAETCCTETWRTARSRWCLWEGMACPAWPKGTGCRLRRLGAAGGAWRDERMILTRSTCTRTCMFPSPLRRACGMTTAFDIHYFDSVLASARVT
jgi:hypothetical protein